MASPTEYCFDLGARRSVDDLTMTSEKGEPGDFLSSHQTNNIASTSQYQDIFYIKTVVAPSSVALIACFRKLMEEAIHRRLAELELFFDRTLLTSHNQCFATVALGDSLLPGYDNPLYCFDL